MADQDAQDINQMMSASDVPVSQPKKSKFLWIVLGCVVVGVGLGMVVYQQSVKTVPVVKTTPRPTSVAVAPTPMPLESPTAPVANFVTAVANTMTFPQTGKVRVFSDLNNIQLVITITTDGATKTLTIPNRAVNATTPMNFTDSTFDVTAGSTGTIKSYLNATTGAQNLGWIAPTADNKCGANQGGKVDMTAKLTWVQSKLATGQTIFAKQCWADPGSKTVIEDNDFNDFFLVWSYAAATTTSPSPSASAVASGTPTPSAVATSTPTPSPSATAKASSSPASGTANVATPTPTARAVMPDTTDGVPVTGIFEITVGTVSVGLVLLVLGLLGLLAL